jgi:hypothetical protein
MTIHSRDITSSHKSLRPLLIAGMKALNHIDQVAQFTPYVWTTDEGYSDEDAGDAINVMNAGIIRAREIMGCTPLAASEIGEQETETA